MIRWSSRAACPALFVVLVLSGCGPEDRPLARVADRTITVRDFERAARDGAANIPLPAEQARPLLLERLVQRQLLVAAAHARGIDTTSVVRNYRRAMSDQSLLARLSSEIAPIDVGATEAEVRQLYAWRQTQYEVEIVYGPDTLMLRRARGELALGRPWAQVADEFGGMAGMPPGGSLGTRLPGTLPQPLDDAMRALKVGAIGGPYHAPQGWFLMRVTARSKAPDHPFDSQRAALLELLRQRKWQAALLAHIAALAPEYHVSHAPEGVLALFQVLSPARMGNLSAPEPDAAARRQVLATWDGGTYTLGDAMDDLNRPEIPKPGAAFMPTIRDWLRERVLTRVAFQEARRRHLDEEPAVADRVRDQVDDYVGKSVLVELASSIPPPDEAALRAAWTMLRERNPQLQNNPQAPPDWDHLGADMKQAVTNNLVQRTRDDRLAAFTDSLRRVFNTVVMPEPLKHVAWPSAAGTAP